MEENKEKLLKLVNQREELEKQISFLQEEHRQAFSTTTSTSINLVEEDGFPRSDVDIHAIRIIRNKLAKLQKDHLELMKQIESLVFSAKSISKLFKSSISTSSSLTTSTLSNQSDIVIPYNISSVSPQPTIAVQDSISASRTNPATKSPPISPASLPPFYVVRSVTADSPSHLCGLKIGDKILKFSNITKSNFSAQAISRIVTNSVNRSIEVTVYRQGEGVLEVRLVPQQWTGKGLLGCHLVDV